MSIILPTGVHADVAGGPVAAVTQHWGKLNNKLILVVPDPVAYHEGTGSGDHDAAIMVTGSQWFTINGKPVCRLADAASCGDLLTASQDWFQIT